MTLADIGKLLALRVLVVAIFAVPIQLIARFASGRSRRGAQWFAAGLSNVETRAMAAPGAWRG